MRRIFLTLLCFTFFIPISTLYGQGSDDHQIFKGVCLKAPREPFKGNPFQPVKNIGANAVAVIPYAFCKPEKPKVRYNYKQQWWGETIKGVRKTLAYAREKNLRVNLKPHLWVVGEGWPGDLVFSNDQARETWQDSYRSYIMQMAKLAGKQEVAMFTIGTECKKLAQHFPAYWRDLIRDVRAVYGGKVTYQANWDNFKKVAFWDQLDYISVSGYFPLKVDQENPSQKALKAAWEPHIAKLKRIHLAYDKPVIFGEYGYCSKEGAIVKPWQGSRTDAAAVDLEIQKRAYEALYEVIWDKEWFHGGFLWKWHPHHQQAGGRESASFTPQRKPAEKLIKSYYKTF